MDCHRGSVSPHFLRKRENCLAEAQLYTILTVGRQFTLLPHSADTIDDRGYRSRHRTSYFAEVGELNISVTSKHSCHQKSLDTKAGLHTHLECSGAFGEQSPMQLLDSRVIITGIIFGGRCGGRKIDTEWSGIKHLVSVQGRRRWARRSGKRSWALGHARLY